MKNKAGITRTTSAIIIVILIVVAGAAAILLATGGGTSSTTSSSSTSAQSSSSATSSGGSAAGATLNYATAQQITDIDPGTDIGGSNIYYDTMFYESLLNMDSTNQIVPNLATSWNISADGLHYTLTLRQGVTFHDGTPFNSTAVVVSINRGIALKQFEAQFLSAVQNVQALSNYVVQINLKHADPDFLATLASSQALAIVSPSAVQKYQANSTELAHNWFSTHEDGTGPYTLVTFSPGVSIKATAYQQYWQGWSGKHFTNIYAAWVNDPSTRKLELTSGQVDLAEALSATDAQSLPSGFTAQWYPARAIVYLFLDLSNPYLAQPNFRKAVAYAINYTALLNAIYPNSLAARGPLPSSMAAFNSSLPYPAQNLTLAKEYLAKTNYTASGSPTFTMVWNDYSWKLQTCEAIQSDLAKIGINVQIKQLTYPVLAAGLSKPGTYDMYIFYQSTWVNGPFAILNTLYNGTYVDNVAGNHPVQVQQLLSKAYQDAGNPSAFQQDIKSIQSVAVQNQYQIYLADLYENFAYSNNHVSHYVWFPGDDPTAAVNYYAMSPP